MDGTLSRLLLFILTCLLAISPVIVYVRILSSHEALLPVYWQTVPDWLMTAVGYAVVLFLSMIYLYVVYQLLQIPEDPREIVTLGVGLVIINLVYALLAFPALPARLACGGNHLITYEGYNLDIAPTYTGKNGVVMRDGGVYSGGAWYENVCARSGTTLRLEVFSGSGDAWCLISVDGAVIGVERPQGSHACVLVVP